MIRQSKRARGLRPVVGAAVWAVFVAGGWLPALAFPAHAADEPAAPAAAEKPGEGSEKGEVGEKVENGPTITFDDQPFELRFKQHVKGMTLNEYIPKSETLERWRQKIAVRYFAGETDHEKAANGLVAAIAKQNPGARYKLWQSKDGSLTGVDFVLTDGKSIAEFNVFLYHTDAEKKGVVAEQYAMRVYGERIPPFIESLIETREYLLEKVIRYRFPEVVP